MSGSNLWEYFIFRYEVKSFTAIVVIEKTVKSENTSVTFKVVKAAVAQKYKSIAALFQLRQCFLGSVIESAFAVVYAFSHIPAQHKTCFFPYFRVKLRVKAVPHICGIESKPAAYLVVGVFLFSYISVVGEPFHRIPERRSVGEHGVV